MDLSAVSKATAKAESSLDIAKYTSLAIPAVSILVCLAIFMLVFFVGFCVDCREKIF